MQMNFMIDKSHEFLELNLNGQQSYITIWLG